MDIRASLVANPQTTELMQPAYRSLNDGRWQDLGFGFGGTGRWLEPTDQLAYWGIAYASYAKNRKVSHGPGR